MSEATAAGKNAGSTKGAVLTEVLAQQFLLRPREAALGRDGDQQRGVGGHLARGGEVEVLHLEVAHLELVARG